MKFLLLLVHCTCFNRAVQLVTYKTSSTVPIPKPSANTDNPHNYRPISLYPVVSSLLERHMNSLVSEHLVERNLISDAQGGFTHGKLTITALCQTFMTSFSFWSLPHVLDLRKDFDSVPHLPHSKKFKRHPTRVTFCYPSDRQHYVVIDHATSKSSTVLSGVPQGLVLGPLLLQLIYINCMCRAPLSEGSKISMYANDVLLCKPITILTTMVIYKEILMLSMNA